MSSGEQRRLRFYGASHAVEEILPETFSLKKSIRICMYLTYEHNVAFMLQNYNYLHYIETSTNK